MAADRYVLLGLAGVRAAWFGDVARWATSATLPVDFVKVVSLEEARARLRSGRPFSALVVDSGLAALDRDLVELATGHGCAVIAADDGRAARPWRELGVHAVLPTGFGPEQLLDALRAVSRPMARGDELGLPTQPEVEAASGAWRGRVVAVTGAGGVGRSTLAMALASGLAADPRDRGLVVLADLALHAHQALLHDVGDVVPGLLELVEAHRGAELPPDQVRALCFTLAHGGYDLLLGLRRHRDWTALRPRACDAALASLSRTFRHVVADVDADVEGDAQCGSADVEDRNTLARHTLRRADLVLAVGLPGIAGVHSHLRVMRDLLELGVDPGRVVPVVNRAPRIAAAAGRGRQRAHRAARRGGAGRGDGVDTGVRPRTAPPRRGAPATRLPRRLRWSSRSSAPCGACSSGPATSRPRGEAQPEPVRWRRARWAAGPTTVRGAGSNERASRAAVAAGRDRAAVQDRAKDIALDMAAPDGEASCAPSSTTRSPAGPTTTGGAAAPSTSPTPTSSPSGPTATSPATARSTPLLADDDVWEVMINAPDAIFVKRHRGPSGYHDEVFHDDDHVVRTLTKILDDAVDRPPQARPHRGAAGRPARRRRPAPHRPRRHRPRRPRAW